MTGKNPLALTASLTGRIWFCVAYFLETLLRYGYCTSSRVAFTPLSIGPSRALCVQRGTSPWTISRPLSLEHIGRGIDLGRHGTPMEVPSLATAARVQVSFPLETSPGKSVEQEAPSPVVPVSGHCLLHSACHYKPPGVGDCDGPVAQRIAATAAIRNRRGRVRRAFRCHLGGAPRKPHRRAQSLALHRIEGLSPRG